MIRTTELAEPRTAARGGGRRNALHGVDEQHAARLGCRGALRGQQAADFMIQIGNDQSRGFEAIARA
jgi:hypothetical protein